MVSQNPENGWGYITWYNLWVPGVNALGSHGRWAFAEFRSANDIEADFAALIEDLLETQADIGLANARRAERSIGQAEFIQLLKADGTL